MLNCNYGSVTVRRPLVHTVFTIAYMTLSINDTVSYTCSPAFRIQLFYIIYIINFII